MHGKRERSDIRSTEDQRIFGELSKAKNGLRMSYNREAKGTLTGLEEYANKNTSGLSMYEKSRNN